MSNFVIIPDSSADMTANLRERFSVPAVLNGVIYKPDGTQMLADVDWKSITPQEYYKSMKGRNILYKTATPPLGEVMNIFESFLKNGLDILSISLSSALSGTYQNCKTIADELMKKYPERKIICVDSLRYASATALLILKACEMRDNGATIDETADYLNKLKYTIHQMGPLDDLFFCVKTGRISNFKALFGTLVGVNSLGDFSNEGLSAVVGKIKGHSNALEATVRYVKKMIRNPEDQILIIGHSDREESANKLAERIRKEIKPKEVIINPIGMSCGASIGPGLCAVYFVGDPISDECIIEKKVLEEIIREIKQK